MNTLLAVAILPAAALLFYVYKMDPVEKEPGKLLATLLGFGVLSTVPAVILEMIGSSLFIDNAPSTFGTLVLENFVVVALVEEACKFFFLRWRTWNHPSFDYIFDGIVYAVFVSLGFAIAENIVYVFQFGLGTGIARAFTAIPGHCIFAIFMGYFYARAKLARVKGDQSGYLFNIVCSLVVPVLCHGLYDLCASIDGTLPFIVFFVFLIGMAVVAWRLIKQLATEAARITQSAQPEQPYGGYGL